MARPRANPRPLPDIGPRLGQALLNAAAVVACRRDGVVEYLSGPAAGLLGVKPGHAEGVAFREVFGAGSASVRR